MPDKPKVKCSQCGTYFNSETDYPRLDTTYYLDGETKVQFTLCPKCLNLNFYKEDRILKKIYALLGALIQERKANKR